MRRKTQQQGMLHNMGKLGTVRDKRMEKNRQAIDVLKPGLSIKDFASSTCALSHSVLAGVLTKDSHCASFRRLSLKSSCGSWRMSLVARARTGTLASLNALALKRALAIHCWQAQRCHDSTSSSINDMRLDRILAPMSVTISMSALDTSAAWHKHGIHAYTHANM